MLRAYGRLNSHNAVRARMSRLHTVPQQCMNYSKDSSDSSSSSSNQQQQQQQRKPFSQRGRGNYQQQQQQQRPQQQNAQQQKSQQNANRGGFAQRNTQPAQQQQRTQQKSQTQQQTTQPNQPRQQSQVGGFRGRGRGGARGAFRGGATKSQAAHPMAEVESELFNKILDETTSSTPKPQRKVATEEDIDSIMQPDAFTAEGPTLEDMDAEMEEDIHVSKKDAKAKALKKKQTLSKQSKYLQGTTPTKEVKFSKRQRSRDEDDELLSKDKDELDEFMGDEKIDDEGDLTGEDFGEDYLESGEPGFDEVFANADMEAVISADRDDFEFETFDDESEESQNKGDLELEMVEKYSEYLKENYSVPAAVSIHKLQKLNSQMWGKENYQAVMKDALVKHIATHNTLHSDDLAAIVLTHPANALLDSADKIIQTIRNDIKESVQSGALSEEYELVLRKFAPALIDDNIEVNFESKALESIVDKDNVEIADEVDRVDEVEEEDDALSALAGEGDVTPVVEQTSVPDEDEGLVVEKTKQVSDNIDEAETEEDRRRIGEQILNNNCNSNELLHRANVLGNTANSISPMLGEKLKEMRLKELKGSGKLTPEILEAYTQQFPLRDLAKLMSRELAQTLRQNPSDNIDEICQNLFDKYMSRGIAAEHMKMELAKEQEIANKAPQEGAEATPVQSPSITIENTTVPSAFPTLKAKILPELKELIMKELAINDTYLIYNNYLTHAKKEHAAGYTSVYNAIKSRLDEKQALAQKIGEVKDDDVYMYDIPRLIKHEVAKSDAEKSRKRWIEGTFDEEELFVQPDMYRSKEAAKTGLQKLNNAFGQEAKAKFASNFTEFKSVGEEGEESLADGEENEVYMHSILDSHTAVHDARFKKRLEEYEFYVDGPTIPMPHIKDVSAVVTAGKRGRQRIIAPIERYFDEYIDSLPQSLAQDKILNAARAIAANPTVSIAEKQAIIRGLRDSLISHGIDQIQLTPETMPVKLNAGKRTHMHPNRVNPRDARVAELVYNREELMKRQKAVTKASVERREAAQR